MASNRQRRPATAPASNVGHYSLSEAARVLGVHYETAARWVRSGKLRGVKLSRRKVMVPRQSCEALLSGQSAEAPASETGSLHHWLPLIGSLSPKEGARLRALAQDFETVEDEA